MRPFADRRAKLGKTISRLKLDALLVTNFVNVTYLTGFTGDDSYLIVTPDDALIISDERYTTQIEQECPGLPTRIRDTAEKLLPVTVGELTGLGVQRLGVEQASMTLGTHSAIQQESSGLKLEPTDGLVEELRQIKDRGEIDTIRHACLLARRTFDVIRATWAPDATELDIARELEYHARRFGGSGLSFPPIVAAGPRAALPHASPTEARVGDHLFTLIDWGVFYNNYASDLTRMVVTGPTPKRFDKVYNTVLEAQMAAIEAIQPGKSCEEIDSIARKIISKAGYGKRFGHGLGHGLGLEVHEGPRLSKKQGAKLKPGMVVTVEPGVYYPEWGGVRIEDDVLVTRTGYEVLSSVPKNLDECVIA